MKFITIILISIKLYLIQLSICDPSITLDNDVYIIEQAVDNYDYFQVGFVNLRQIKQNQNAAQYQNIDLTIQQSNAQDQQQQQQQTFHLTPLEINQLDKKQLEQIENNKNNANSILKVRLCKQLASINLKKCYASTFTFLKNFVQSGYRLNLTINTGVNNHLNSISIKTTSNGPDNSGFKQSEHPEMIIYAKIQSIRSAQQADTESYLEKLRIETEQKEKSAQSGNESFFSKYWIYIVPFLVIVVLMNIANPEAAGAPGAAGGRLT